MNQGLHVLFVVGGDRVGVELATLGVVEHGLKDVAVVVARRGLKELIKVYQLGKGDHLGSQLNENVLERLIDELS